MLTVKPDEVKNRTNEDAVDARGVVLVDSDLEQRQIFAEVRRATKTFGVRVVFVRGAETALVTQRVCRHLLKLSDSAAKLFEVAWAPLGKAFGFLAIIFQAD